MIFFRVVYHCWMFGCENMHMFPLVGIGVDRMRERGRTALGHIIIKCLQSGLLPFPSECVCVCLREKLCERKKECMCLWEWECVREREKVCVFTCFSPISFVHANGIFSTRIFDLWLFGFYTKRLTNCRTQINVSLALVVQKKQ